MIYALYTALLEHFYGRLSYICRYKYLYLVVQKIGPEEQRDHKKFTCLL